MQNDLVVNPFLKVEHYSAEGGPFIFSWPQPGSGLQSMTLERENESHLYDALVDVGAVRFDYLDPVNDLTDAERQRLTSNGFLISGSAAPDLPLFECTLDDVDAFTGVIDEELVANPSLRFEPFDLSRFAVWAREKHLDPTKATAWVKTLRSDVEVGYWLDTQVAKIVADLSPDKRIDPSLDDDIVRKLIGAEILIRPSHYEREREEIAAELSRANAAHTKTKYAVIRQLIPRAQIRAMKRYYRQYVAQGFMQFGDDQVKRRYYQHNEPVAAALHSKLASFVTRIVGEEVLPSYVYAASYVEGAELVPHVDRAQCEFSISFQVDYEPECADDRSPWPILVEPLVSENGPPPTGVIFGWEHKESWRGDDPSAINLANGDGLIYRGRELVHYRERLKHGHRSTSLFFHFVAKDFDGGLL